MAETYLRATDAALPDGVLDELLDAVTSPLPRRIRSGRRSGPPAGGTDPEAAAGQAILGDAKLGPVARTLILLWYRGAWTALPEAWRSAYGASPHDADHVVSARGLPGRPAVGRGRRPPGGRPPAGLRRVGVPARRPGDRQAPRGPPPSGCRARPARQA